MGRRITSRVLDFSGGIVGGISDYTRKVRHLRIADNVFVRPHGALSVRKGSQRLSSSTLTLRPHSILEWVSNTGSSKAFVGCEDSAGKLIEAQTGAFNTQTVPYPLAANAKLVGDQLHGSLWVCEQAGSAPPIFYRGDAPANPANTWHTGRLPRPAFPDIPINTPVAVVSGTATLPGGTFVTPGVAAGAVTMTLNNNAGGVTGDCVLRFGTAPYTFDVPNCQLTAGLNTVTYDGPGAAAGTQMTLAGAAPASPALTPNTQYWYRLRYRYINGSSIPTMNVHTFTTGAGPNVGIDLSQIANEIRSDYLGWILERTVAGGTAAGPFYFVAIGTGTTYQDRTADADVGYRSNDVVLGEPVHFDGIIAHRDRLVGWVGSTLWFSQAIADIQFTGVANWNPLNSLDVGLDDGDHITAVVTQVDRLAVFKTSSVWVVEGDSPTNFRAFRLVDTAGASGARAAASAGSTVYFHGAAGFHRIRGNSVEPFAWLEVGHIFDTFLPNQLGDVQVLNYLGQYILVFFASGTTHNDDCLVYDLRFGAWTRIRGWFISDAVQQRGGPFGDRQTLLTIDRKDRDTGAGTDYPVWLTFFGFKDEKASNGTGGTAPQVVIETPMIDDGSPDVEKDWELVQAFLSGVNIVASMTLTLDPPGSASISLASNDLGAIWGVPNWGAFEWATLLDSAPHLGLPSGSVGRRYSWRMTCAPTSSFTFNGFTMTGILQPSADYSRGR